MGKLLVGDVFEQMRTLPDNSVDCCVTSPPYWGLRDYGTAKWEGGSADCDHKIPAGEHDPKRGNFQDAGSSHTVRFNRGSCYKCGAIRVDAQIGLEKTPDEYVAKLVKVFREVRRVLKPTGTLWLNLGDSYAGGGKGNYGKGLSTHGGKVAKHAVGSDGLKPKDLVGIPWKVAFALQADGWWLRQDIIWAKPNPMPESVTDRCTKSHEYIFLLSKSPKYFYDFDAVKQPAAGVSGGACFGKVSKMGEAKSAKAQAKRFDRPVYKTRNLRDVWTIPVRPFKGAHFATFPPTLPEICIKAGTKKGQTVLDPFFGAGTVGVVAEQLGRDWIGIEVNPKYAKIAKERIISETSKCF